MTRHPEKFDQNQQARQPAQTHYPHHGQRIRDQNPREHEANAPRERGAGDEEE